MTKRKEHIKGMALGEPARNKKMADGLQMLAKDLHDANSTAIKKFREGVAKEYIGQLCNALRDVSADRVTFLGGDWQDHILPHPEGDQGGKPMLEMHGERGEIRRVVTHKFPYDVDELRAGLRELPDPSQIAASIIESLNSGPNKCKPGRDGKWIISSPEIFVKSEAYMLEMFMYLYAVDFGRMPE